MQEKRDERVREAIMGTFRGWGGQWNVSVTPPEDPEAPEDGWFVRVHSRPIVRDNISAEVVEAFLADPDDPAAVRAWQAELRPIFERARAPAG